MRRVLVPLLLAAFVSFPAAREAWRDHEIDTRGRAVQATVVHFEHTHTGYFVTYQVPHDVDPTDKKVAAVVTKAAFDQAASGHLEVKVVPHSSLNAPVGEVRSSVFLWIAIIGDTLVAAFVITGWRRRRRWSRMVVTAVEGNHATVAVGGLRFVVEPPRAWSVGQVVRGDLSLAPEGDVEPGATTTEIADLGDGRYRVTGRVRSARSDGFTEMLLERGMPLRISSEEVRHEARPKELGTVTGRFVVKPR